MKEFFKMFEMPVSIERVNWFIIFNVGVWSNVGIVMIEVSRAKYAFAAFFCLLTFYWLFLLAYSLFNWIKK